MIEEGMPNLAVRLSVSQKKKIKKNILYDKQKVSASTAETALPFISSPSITSSGGRTAGPATSATWSWPVHSATSIENWRTPQKRRV